MNKSMWNSEAVKAYESGQGVMMVKEPHPHYVPIPQRTWVGLTDEEISAIDWKSNETLHDFARAIEAKLKDKNS
jgi:hypothetical protein